jgi:hypothetical protein
VQERAGASCDGEVKGKRAGASLPKWGRSEVAGAAERGERSGGARAEERVAEHGVAARNKDEAALLFLSYFNDTGNQQHNSILVVYACSFGNKVPGSIPGGHEFLHIPVSGSHLSYLYSTTKLTCGTDLSYFFNIPVHLRATWRPRHCHVGCCIYDQIKSIVADL